MTIPATIHDEPRIYSNGAEHVPVDHVTWSGPLVATDIRLLDGFYAHQSGFLDAPDFIAAGSMAEVTRTTGKRGTVQTFTSRTL